MGDAAPASNTTTAAEVTAAAAGASLASIAGQASDVLKNVMKMEPTVAGIAGMFVPQVAIVQPWILMLAPFLEKSLDDIKAGNGGDAVTGLLQLATHISKNGANSPFLTPPASASSDASQQGSG